MVNPVDFLGTELDPLASDKNGGADFEWHIGVEFPYNRSHFGDRGCTECLPAAVLDDEVEEHIRGWKTSFWDKRVVEQGLMVYSLSLPGNEPMGILQGRGGGDALEVEPDLCLFAKIDFCGGIGVDLG